MIQHTITYLHRFSNVEALEPEVTDCRCFDIRTDVFSKSYADWVVWRGTHANFIVPEASVPRLNPIWFDQDVDSFEQFWDIRKALKMRLYIGKLALPSLEWCYMILYLVDPFCWSPVDMLTPDLPWVWRQRKRRLTRPTDWEHLFLASKMASMLSVSFHATYVDTFHYTQRIEYVYIYTHEMCVCVSR